MQVDAIESDEYFQKRSLKGGAVGWVLLVSLGVAYTVSGDFSGWNYGMEHGGWLGLAIAWLIMGIMYLCTVFGLAELSSAIPAAGAERHGSHRRVRNGLGACHRICVRSCGDFHVYR